MNFLPSFSYLSRRDWSLLVGNALDHFDSALYGLLAPILAPLFFPHHDPVVQLILAYSVLGTSLITRPLGAFIFGVWAHKSNPMRVLSFSLMGVAVSTAAMGFLPLHASIGGMAAFGLILLRLIRGTFAAGDGTIAKVYILENKTRRQSASLSHLYQSFSMLGTIVASLVVTLILLTPSPTDYWRWPFWAGAFTAFIGLYLRREVKSQSVAPSSFSLPSLSAVSLLKKDYKGVFKIAGVTNIAWLTYAVPFVFLNTFVPLVTSITLAEMMALNTIFLWIDMLLIPFIGEVFKKFSPKQVMGGSGLVLMMTLFPLFHFMEGSSLGYVIFVRFWIILLGIIYLCPLHVFYLDQFKGNQKYLLIGMGNALSAATVGKLTPAIGLFLWHETGWIGAPALYMVILCAFGVWALKKSRG